jgi:hypothetical protein
LEKKSLAGQELHQPRHIEIEGPNGGPKMGIDPMKLRRAHRRPLKRQQVSLRYLALLLAATITIANGVSLTTSDTAHICVSVAGAQDPDPGSAARRGKK